jgi:hypothetical protein
MTAIDRTNDGTQVAPYLRRDINLGTVLGLPHGSTGFRQNLTEQLAMIKTKGYVAAQSWDDSAAVLAAGLRASGMAYITDPRQSDPIARAHKDAGLDATTIHLGNSFETDAEIDALVASVLEASGKYAYPFYIETHRATLTQDIYRTVAMVQRFPEIRFNADLSHYYTGHELTYGGQIHQRMGRLNLILERTRFMHGRIANTGCIQAPVSDEGEYVDHFRTMWQRCFEGFLRGAKPGDYLSFNPEILPMRVGSGEHTMWLHYAQQRPALVSDPLEGEPTDRFAEADALWDIACAAFEAARTAIANASDIAKS